MSRLVPRRSVLAAGALGPLLAACGSAEETTTSAPGVTAESVTLGVLVDLSGDQKNFATPMVAGGSLYVQRFNEAGGVGGRTVDLVVRDHEYDAQRAAGLYDDMEPEILGLLHLQGSSISAELSQKIAADRLLTAPVSWSSSILTNPYFLVPGATYDVQMVSALDRMVTEGDLDEGDTVGIVRVADTYGSNALRGATWAAQQLGLELVDVPITNAQTNMTSTMARLAEAGVSAVLMATAATAARNALDVSQSSGLLVPFAGTNVTFDVDLLTDDEDDPMLTRFTVMSPYAAGSSPLASVAEIVDAYATEYPDAPFDDRVVYGWAVARAFLGVLQDAAERFQLTRSGVATAFGGASTLAMDGLTPDLDLSEGGSPTTRTLDVLRPDPSAVGSLAVVTAGYLSDLAQEYVAPVQA